MLCNVLFVALVHLGHVVVVALAHQAIAVHEASERAHGEGTPAEAEQEQLVARHMVVEDEAVDRADVVFNALAKGAAGELVERPAGAHTAVVIDDLVHAVGAFGLHGARDLGHVGGPAFARRLVDLVALVPGAVGTDDDAFHVPLGLVFRTQQSSHSACGLPRGQ